MITAAEQKADQFGIPMCIAVIDEPGDLNSFSRMYSGEISSISIAIDKAFTDSAAKTPLLSITKFDVPAIPRLEFTPQTKGIFA